MSKHTPGPWVVAQRQLPADRKPDDCTELLHMDGYAIYVARNTLSDDPAADIALIAAAPELLEALQTLTTALAIQQQFERGRGMKDADAWTPLIEAARAALAKADGTALKSAGAL